MEAGERNSIERVRAAREQAETELLFAPQAQAIEATSGTFGFGYENIVGVGIGEKESRQRPTGETAVTVYVVQKAPEDAVETSSLVPREYEGVPTDVVESGEFVIATGRGRIRPATGGISIGSIEPMTGTLGFVVRKGGDWGVLSNNHVLAQQNEGRKGDPVLQPGPADGGTRGDSIGELADWVPLDFAGRENVIDAAYARVEQGALTVGVYEIEGVVWKPADLGRRELVRKSGRTTGLTRGITTDVDATIRLKYRAGFAILREQILVKGDGGAFSDQGDSGSPVIADTSLQPVGMLCGGSPVFSVVNRIGRVLEALDVSFPI